MLWLFIDVIYDYKENIYKPLAKSPIDSILLMCYLVLPIQIFHFLLIITICD